MPASVGRKRLSLREEAFARAYVATRGNASEAARRAGYSDPGKHSAAIRVRGHELVTRRNVTERIDELAEYVNQVSGLTPDRIAAMLAKEAHKAETDGARVRAIELLGKWKGMFRDVFEDATARAPDDALAAALAAELGLEKDVLLQRLMGVVGDATMAKPGEEPEKG